MWYFGDGTTGASELVESTAREDGGGVRVEKGSVGSGGPRLREAARGDGVIEGMDLRASAQGCGSQR